jgi:hypothetical protein
MRSDFIIEPCPEHQLFWGEFLETKEDGLHSLPLYRAYLFSYYLTLITSAIDTVSLNNILVSSSIGDHGRSVAQNKATRDSD